jgi:hypothetical protein
VSGWNEDARKFLVYIFWSVGTLSVRFVVLVVSGVL